MGYITDGTVACQPRKNGIDLGLIYAIFDSLAMRKIFKKLAGFWRLAVVLLAVTALTLNGAGSAERLFHQWEEPSSTEQSVADLMLLVEGPPSPDQLPFSMTPGGKPWVEQSACLTTPLIVKPENTENRGRFDADTQSLLISAVVQINRFIAVRTSTAQVSPRLGIQFTLVGAKPSGTS